MFSQPKGYSFLFSLLPAGDIGGTLGFVLLSSEFDLSVRVSLSCVEALPKEGNTPSAASPGATTFADLAGHLWLMNPNEVVHLASGDVEAVTKFVVRLHHES